MTGEINLDEVKLKSGSHKDIGDGACIMEMVSYMANEPWSDHPKCACPILTEYAIRLNDRFNDDDRQKLKPLILKLINTRADDVKQIERKRLIMWRNVTATFPLILDLIKLPEIAEKLRALKNNNEDMVIAATILKENRDEIMKNSDAYANAYANANVYAYADADAYVYVYAYADADAYVYANAYAYANAYVYVDTFRAKLADTAVETLRMACEL